jgi:MFS family permease
MTCALIVCVFGREKSSIRPEVLESRSFMSLTSFPEEFNTVYVASLLSWFGWFSALIYQVNFVSREVAKPTTSAEFEESERSAFLGLMLGSIVSAIASLFIPRLTQQRMTSSLKVWAVSCGILAAILASSPLVAWWGNTGIGTLWLASFGLVYAVTNSVPYSLISVMLHEKKSTVAVLGDEVTAGRAMGMLNVAVCIPQIITSVVGGPIISEFHSDIPCFLIGSVCAAGASFVLADKVKELRRGYARAPMGYNISSVTQVL